MQLKEKQFNFRLSLREYEDLEECAKAMKMTKTKLVRMLLQRGIVECRINDLL